MHAMAQIALWKEILVFCCACSALNKPSWPWHLNIKCHNSCRYLNWYKLFLWYWLKHLVQYLHELYTTHCAFHHCVGGRLAHSKLQLKGVIISSFHTIPYHCHPTTSYHNTIILTYHTLPYYWSINILHPIILSLSYYHPSEQTSLISMPELKIRNDSIHGVSSSSSGNLWK